MVINYSTGAVGVPVAKRIAYLRELRPDVAALNMGSMNFAKYSRRRRELVFSMVFANPFDEIVELLEAMNELGIKPEHECFDLGHLGSLAPLVHMGILREPLHVSCVMGVLGGVPPTARNLAAMVDNVPAGSHWGLIGVSREQWMLAGAALSARRLRARRPRGQLLPAGRHDGALQRRADRAGARGWSSRSARRRGARVDGGARASARPVPEQGAGG